MKGIRITSDSKRVNVYKHGELIGYYSTFDHARVARNDESPSWLTTVIPSNAEAVWSMFLSKLREIHSIHFSLMVDHKPSSLMPYGESAGVGRKGTPWYDVPLDIETRGEPGYFGLNWQDKKVEFFNTLNTNSAKKFDYAEMEARVVADWMAGQPKKVTLDEDESIVIHAGIDDISFVVARTPRGVIVTVNQPDIDGRVGVIYDEPTVNFEND